MTNRYINFLLLLNVCLPIYLSFFIIGIIQDTNMKKIAVINGPNLNLLGIREPDIYGRTTLKEIIANLKKEAKKYNIKIKAFQSNHEGKIVDFIQKIGLKKYFGIIINPGALTHYSIAIRDAIKAFDIPAVEVHLSDIENREDFRKISVIKDVCVGQVKGLGAEGYKTALEKLMSFDKDKN